MTLRAVKYMRYSTDKQRKESIEDQARVCESLAQRKGFLVVGEYADRALSGGTTRRPQYQMMLAAARRGEFDVILAEDTSRLWRNMAEQSPRLAELADLGVHVVTSDVDTREESSAMIGAFKGAASEDYRREIGRRTFRGNEGNALNQRPTGGRAFGYETVIVVPAKSHRDRAVTERRIVPERAQIVVQIYEWYAVGWSPRRIANELNARGIPSPGADWAREENGKRQDGKWLASAIHGDPKTGTGILCNPIYHGEVIWNRVHWCRSRTDSSVRKPVPNDPSKWIRYELPALRIVPEDLWLRVQARRRSRTSAARPIERRHPATGKIVQSRAGKVTKHALSGVLKCSECGGSYSIASMNQYACSTRVNGGEHACSNNRWVGRRVIEKLVADQIQNALLTPARIELMRRHLAATLSARTRDAGHEDAARAKRLGELGREIANMIAFIRQGGASPTLAADLAAAELERARLTAAAERPTPEAVRLLPDAVARYRALVANLPAAFAADPDRARELVRRLVGIVRLVRVGKKLYAELEVSPGRLLDLTGNAVPEGSHGVDGSGGRI